MVNSGRMKVIIQYVLMNPVSAGLVQNWKDWKFTYCHPDYIVL